MKRREYLTGLAGLGALSATGQVGAEAGTQRLSLTTAVGDDTYAPGAPRFAPLGVTFYDRLKTDFDTDHAGGKDRDNFAPHIVGDPKRDPDNHSADDFSWSIKSAPDGSSATIEYAPADGDMEQYDSGKHNVAEFAPDVPGRYVLELTAPDGKYEQILHIFPKDGNQGGPPRIDIEGHYDSDADEFVLDSNPKLAPNSPMTDSDLFVAWLADNRDTLATDDITVGDGTNSWTARIPKSALGGETGRVHAAPSDTNASGYSETVVLDPTNETIEYPNRPPEWLQNGIMYEIFPRSFMGPPKSGEWPLYNSNANFKAFESKLDYLNELNVDVIWFTPVVPSESGNWKRQNYKQYPDRFKYVGGGPHGYDALSYFDIAEDLTSKYQYPDYKDALWPYEDGYNPDDNMRVKARESAMSEFQSFLDAAHERDIKVCLDFVINHGGRHHRFFQDTIGSLSDFRPQGWSYPGVAKNNENSKYFDWFARKKGPNTTNDGKVVDVAPAATGFAGLRVEPQWNYGNVALREHILAAAKNWASMGVDAFRCDIAYGVPHSFWKEVRNTVRAENSEFMMLDETIPNDPSFAEDEFDLHFDTSGYLTTNHQVVNGGDPMKLYDVIASRDNEGWPEYTLITNNAEDHDEQRLYKIARDGSREDPAKAQRACWAAGVTLPGVPFIYYGQERLITEYGHTRFNYDGKGNDPRSGDVGPNKFKRAFMNWEENGDTVPQEHLQFYKDVTTFYKETDILKPGADLKKTWFRSDDDVLVFGRSMESDTGTENAIVMIHFDPGTATVDLLPGASTTDMYTDSDIGVDSEGEAVSVEFDTLAVVEADSLFSVGEQIAKLSEEKGDDNGPGSYTYPTGDAYSDGVFDITEMTIHTTADSVQFRAAIAGDVSNPDDLQHGITAQHLQVYLHNPSAKDGATEGRTGTNVTFAKPYQYRLVADGENGARVEDHQGETVADGSLMVNPVANEIIAEMPKSALDGGIRSHYVAPLMLGYDGDADGNVMAVESKAGAKAFGGADNPGMAPRVIDMVVPETSSQSDALSYSADAKATLPYTSLASEFTQIGKAKDATGDDNGPGNYQYPASPDKEMYDGMWDIETVNVYESRSRVRFEYQLATEIENVWGLDGMSQQFPQVYIRDPDAGEDVPSTTNGRTGLNANFAKPYHYRVVVNGEGTTQVEQFKVNDKGETVSTVASTDVNLSVDGDTISFDLPMEAIGGSPEDKELVSLMAPYDGYGKGGIRQGFAKKPGSYVIGTSGKSTENAPHVMDMVTPDGTSQAQALAYTDSAKAQIPFAEWQKVYVQSEELSPINDAKGDDYGPGTYTYPTSDQIPEGCYDITQVEIKSKTQYWDFTVHVDGPVENPWSYTDGFSPQLLQLYFKDPNAPKDADTTIKGRNGMTSTFQEAYHYRVYVDGNSQMVEDVHGNKLAKDFPTKGHSDNNTITFSLPKAPFDTDDITQMKMAMLVFSQDGYGTGGIRQNFSEKAAQWAFGGVNPDASGNAPRVIDLVGPDAVVDQKEALAYSADSTASIPLTKVEYLMSGEKPNTGMPTAIAPPGPTVFSGNEASLDASNSKDPNGQKLTFEWEQTSGPSASLSGGDTAKPSFTAPDVQEETSLGFKVTVTDPDGNSASATTSATVRPQSDNPAPNVNAKISSGYSQPLQSGDTAAVNAYDSKDPNGGDLSFHWEQTKGPSVSLSGADSAEVFFGVPKVNEETTLTFKVTVSDGQGKSTSDSVSVTVAASSPTTTTTMGGTETSGTQTSGTSSTEKSNNNGSGSGPGFGVVSGALGTAGGIAYAARQLLGDTEAQPEDVTVEDVSDDATVEEEE